MERMLLDKQFLFYSIHSNGLINVDFESEKTLLKKLSLIEKGIISQLDEIDVLIKRTGISLHTSSKINELIKEIIISMEKTRDYIEDAEVLIDKKYWRFYTNDGFINSH